GGTKNGILPRTQSESTIFATASRSGSPCFRRRPFILASLSRNSSGSHDPPASGNGTSASTRTTPLSTVAVSVSWADVGTIPGQSMRYIRRNDWIPFT
ncbi:unnamed protein product, partial [Mycena citricolor]